MVNRELPFKTLEKIGIDGRMPWMIKGMYSYAERNDNWRRNITKLPNRQRRQTRMFTISPILFSFFLDNLLVEMWEKRKGGKQIYALKFTDGVAIIADAQEGLQEMLKDLQRYCEKNEMIREENQGCGI